MESNARLKKKSLSEDFDRNLERIRQLNRERSAEISVSQDKISGDSQNMRQAIDKNTAASQPQAVNSNYDNQIKELEHENDRLSLERDAVGENRLRL